jgi:pSer/pThr/pTyr-binding forkhead associated (FHA) protein
LNGERLSAERPLKDGDRITIGETDIVAHVTAPTLQEVTAEGVGVTVRLDTAKLECAACGAAMPLDAEFCAHCGHRVGAEAPAAGALPSRS